jgi:hypothetical protein
VLLGKLYGWSNDGMGIYLKLTDNFTLQENLYHDSERDIFDEFKP